MSATAFPARTVQLMLGCTLLVCACDGAPSEPLTVVLPPDATILVHGGDNQVAPAGTTLPVPLSVRVTAAGGRPVEGVKIRWTLSQPSGTVAGLHGSLTDDRGIASARRTLGASGGSFTTSAAIEESGAAVTFTTVSQVQGATRMLLLPGDVLMRASDTVRTALPAPLRVLIQDHEERPVPGVTVGWLATGGAVSSVSSVTDAQGIAETTFTRGPIAGQHVVRASVPGLAGSPISFTTNTMAGRPIAVEKLGGDNQVASVFTVLDAPFVVHVVDAYGNSVAGAPVSWFVADDTLAQTPTAANLPGEARPVAVYTHQLDGEQGAQIISAAVSGRPDITPVSFTFTALLAPPLAVSVHDWDYWGYYCYYGGCGFTPSYVTVQPGQAVTWTWQGGQGHNVVFEDDPTAPVSSALKTTGSHTRIFETRGTYRYRCTAHSNGFTQGMVGTVVVSGPPIDATKLEKVSGDNQAGTVGSGLALPFVVHVADAEGHSVAGVIVAWIAETDTGPDVVARSVTDALLPGEVRPVAYHYHVLGGETGVQVITASVEGRPDIAPVSFTYTAQPAPDAMVGVHDWDGGGSWYYCYYYSCGFDPSHVTVSAGKTVTWTWRGTQEHDVVFEDAPTQPVSSPIQATGVHTRTFDTPGTYRYRCTLHSTSFTEGMVGMVVVL